MSAIITLIHLDFLIKLKTKRSPFFILIPYNIFVPSIYIHKATQVYHNPLAYQDIKSLIMIALSFSHYLGIILHKKTESNADYKGYVANLTIINETELHLIIHADILMYLSHFGQSKQ